MPVCFIAFFTNLILFAVKLYIGLSSNSISIYSDGVNNLFDSLSGILSAVCLWAVSRSTDLSSESRSAKIEQLLSFILSVIVGIAGFIFAYNSLERLMYPTPVWFMMKFFRIVLGTAFVKLLMFFFLRRKWKKLGSDVLKVMAYDSLLDFFITGVTVITFLASKNGTYSVDSFCGIFISIVILVSAVKMITANSKSLMNITEKESIEFIEELLLPYGIKTENSELVFSFAGKKAAYLRTDVSADQMVIEDIKKQVFEKTGIEFYIVK